MWQHIKIRNNGTFFYVYVLKLSISLKFCMSFKINFSSKSIFSLLFSESYLFLIILWWHLKLRETFKMEAFAAITNGAQLLAFVAKLSLLDVCEVSGYASSKSHSKYTSSFSTLKTDYHARKVDTLNVLGSFSP